MNTLRNTPRGIGLGLTLAAASVASADTFVVNTLEDFNDGSCELHCTLREAVILTTGTDGPDEILLQAGVYELSLAGAGDDSSFSGDLDINLGEVTIQGHGPGVTVIDALQLDRVFHVGPWSAATLILKDLTIRNGLLGAFDYGAGLMVNWTSTVVLDNVEVLDCDGGDDGGGLRLAGNAVITDSVFRSNSTTASFGNGGAIFARGFNGNVANATIERTLFQGNYANNGGSAIMSYGTAVVTCENCTFSGNTNKGTLNVAAGGVLHLDNCTVTANSRGLVNGGGLITIENTIVSGNSVLDLNGSITSEGHNLVATAAGLVGDTTGNIVGAPGLSPLADNGGATLTHLPIEGSLAIDAGDPGDSPALDQRAFSRPMDGDGDEIPRADIGAVEAGAFAAGDINGDSVINVIDLVTLLAWWGPCSGGCPPDLNGDEIVDMIDLLILLAHWT